jgi:hypothetical protein
VRYRDARPGCRPGRTTATLRAVRRLLFVGLLMSAFGCAAPQSPWPESSAQSGHEPAQPKLQTWQPSTPPQANVLPPTISLAHGTEADLRAPHRACVPELAPREPPTGVAVYDENTPEDDAHRQWAKGFVDAIRTRLLAVQRCYEAALLSAPSLRGHIHLRLIFARDGANISASVEEDTLHAERVTCCLLENARSLRAPPPVEGTSLMVRFPFEFAPQTPAASR